MTIREFDKPRRAVNYSVLRKVKHQKSYDIPVILATNVRELTNKVDEIHPLLKLGCRLMCQILVSLSLVTIYFASIELLQEEGSVFI